MCKGLHCAGCGKGIPASLVLIIVAYLAMRSHVINAALGYDLIVASAILAAVWITTVITFSVFCRKGPRCVYVKTDRFTYSQMKYLESGDVKWLELTGGTIPEIAPRHTIPISGEVERYATRIHRP